MSLRHLAMQLYATMWAHSLRVWRMKWNLVSYAAVTTLWMLVYSYAVIAFTEQADAATVVPKIFWALVAWILLGTPPYAVGNWVKSYINLGLMEQNEIAGVSHRLFLATRVPPALAAAATAALVAGAMLYLGTGANPVVAVEPLAVAAGLLLVLAASTVYSLLLADISIITRVPPSLIDFLSLLVFVAGGVAAPLEALPGPVKALAILLPYSHAGELIRLGAVGEPTVLAPEQHLAAAAALIALTVALEDVTHRVAMRSVRRRGVQGIGVT